MWIWLLHGGLKAVRDALTFAYVADIIDIEEFVFLHDYNRSKPVFPYWKFGEFNLEAWDDVECHTELRFAKNDLHSLVHCLKIPDRIVCQQRTVCSGMEGLCILLKRLSYPYRYTDIVARVGWLEIMSFSCNGNIVAFICRNEMSCFCFSSSESCILCYDWKQCSLCRRRTNSGNSAVYRL